MKHLKKYNEESNFLDKNIEIFVLLFWFWEGDGYLINSYEDCFLSSREAIKSISDIKTKKNKIYLPGQEIPEQSDGGYGQPGFYQIIKKTF